MKTVIPDFKGLPVDPPPLPFQVADPKRLHKEMEKAGVQELQIESLQEEVVFQSAIQLWDWVTHSHPIGAGLVADLTEAQALNVHKVLGDMLRKRAGDSSSAVLTNATHIDIGIK
jgi:hypothetical protein